MNFLNIPREMLSNQLPQAAGVRLWPDTVPVELQNTSEVLSGELVSDGYEINLHKAFDNEYGVGAGRIIAKFANIAADSEEPRWLLDRIVIIPSTN